MYRYLSDIWFPSLTSPSVRQFNGQQYIERLSGLLLFQVFAIQRFDKSILLGLIYIYPKKATTKFKVFIVSVFFICSLLPDISLAQNKVVVIPLMSDCNVIPTVTSAGQVWMDRNLGSPKVAVASIEHVAFGWLYQWGRLPDGHEVWRIGITTTELSSSDVPGHSFFIIPSSFPYDWRSSHNNNLWQGVSGVNNPCPSGFRLPTETEWETERASWSSNDAAGAFASPLKLVTAGYRYPIDGAVYEAGNISFYWSSTVTGDEARVLYFGSSAAGMAGVARAYGKSVRCIKD